MIIQSLLDTDLYKFTMMQVIYHQFSGAKAAYRFKCRNPEADFRPFLGEIREEIEALAELRFAPEEIEYLGGLRYMKPDFVDFLENFRLNPKYIDIQGFADPARDLVEGPMLQTMAFEVPLLAIATEVYYRNTIPQPDYATGMRLLDDKIASLAEMPVEFKISEFGTRRRFGREWQERVVAHMKVTMPQYLFGTSNVDLARRYELTPVGTMAHEFLQAMQVLGGNLRDFQKFAFETWAKEYRGDLGIALSDTIGLEAFLDDFDMFFCKLFDGARQDSGDPFEWGARMIAHYKANRVDPRSKLLMFTDSLDFEKAKALYRRFAGRAIPGFGIGTFITNDLGYPRLDSVIKMVRCNDRPVAKLSDSPGKTMCPDAQYNAYLRHLFTRAADVAEVPS